MREMLKRCSQCILPQNFPGITFNDKGTCNYCLTHKKAKTLGKTKLLNSIEPYRNKGRKYECIVAVSGGRDSAFAAYYAVKVLNLRALAYTYDNGFMPEQTKENVQNTVDLLGVDLIVEKHDYVKKNIKPIMSSWMHKPSPAMIGFLCAGCQTGYVKGLVKTIQNTKIPLIITGSGEPGQPFAKKLLSTSASGKRKLSLILGFLTETVRNPYYILSPSCSIAFAREFFYRFLHKSNSKVMPLFRFIEWNEETLLSVIKNELQWKSPSNISSSWRSDCKIHVLRQYLYLETLGFTKNDGILSGMIRNNTITREDALKRLESENSISEQFVAELLYELGLNLSDLVTALKKYKKTTRKTKILDDAISR
jgi:glucosamine--fructose-6-phosphate aminotransferase (isomerizing)